MAAIARAATEKVAGILAADTGLPFAVASLRESEAAELPAIESAQVLAQNIAYEVAEKKPGVTYPAVYVYCERLVNQLKEKFRTFSGKAEMAAEVRVSHDRLETLSRDLELYASAVAGVLDAQRGDWGGGMFYTGGYKIEFGPVKRGGRNFIQTATISFELDVSN
jgi:hypothetical protein